MVFLALILLCVSENVLAYIMVSDDRAQSVMLERPARRIVSLAPHVTELLFAAGAGEYLVGAVEFSDFPLGARSIPRIGSAVHLDLERLVALRPDLVVGWGSGNQIADLETVERLGLKLFVSEPRGLEAIAQQIRQLGTLAGTTEQAAKSATTFDQRLAALRTRYRDRSRVRVFYQIWHRPLMTVNGEHIISDVVRLCGGHNVFAHLKRLVPTVSLEAVVAANPQAIISGGANRPEEAFATLASWRRFPDLMAVRLGQLSWVPTDLIHRHTPRILDGAERICQALERARQRLNTDFAVNPDISPDATALTVPR